MDNQLHVRMRWARKLAYAAQDDGESSAASYIALLELTNRGKTPNIYVLYRRVMPYRGEDPSLESTQILRLETGGTAWQEVVAEYWLFPPRGVKKNSFPGYESPLWQDTTVWLDRVAAGGSWEQGDHECGKPGRWMRIGTPSSWKGRHKKKPLRFGFPPHILLRLRAESDSIRGEFATLEDAQRLLLVCDDDEESDYYVPKECQAEFEDLEVRIDALKREWYALKHRIDGILNQLRREVRQKFPEAKGITPRRELRKQRRR